MILLTVLLLNLFKKIDPPLFSKHHTVKIGFGYDVHKLEKDIPLILCATNIEHSKGLTSYSDGDVATHALIDALLGAASLGDIGTNFPDNDPKFKNISSLSLLQQTKILLENNDFEPSNIDLTIVAQKPKLKPFIDLMKNNLAVTLNLPSYNVSVKATTEEKLGFTGTEQGIKAFCVAAITKKQQ